MFEVCLIWGGELVTHKADSFIEAYEWIGQYKNVPATNARIWFGAVCVG